MNFEHLFDSLNSKDDTNRANVVSFLRYDAKRLQSQPELVYQIAYEIAGLMATEFARQLSTNDPIDEILIIAGELEVGPDNADDLRDELIQKIETLK